MTFFVWGFWSPLFVFCIFRASESLFGERGCAVSFRFGEISSTRRKNRQFWARPYLRAGYYYSFSWGFWICNQFCCTSNGWARVGWELGESWARVFVTYQYVYQMKAQIILNSNLWNIHLQNMKFTLVKMEFTLVNLEITLVIMKFTLVNSEFTCAHINIHV